MSLEVARACAKKQQIENNISELTYKKENLEGIIRQEKMQVIILNSKMDARVGEITNLDRLISLLKNDIERKYAELTESRAELNQFRGRLDTLTAMHQNTEREIDSETRRQEDQGRIRALESKGRQEKMQITILMNKIDSKDFETQNLDRAVSGLRFEIERRKAELSEAKSELDQNKGRLKVITSTSSITISKLEEVRQSLNTAQSEYRNTKLELEKAQREEMLSEKKDSFNSGSGMRKTL